MPRNMDPYNNVLMYRRARNTFICLVFTLAGAFALMAMIQWIIMLIESNVQNFIKANPYFSSIIFFFALVAISVFIMIERVRFVVPLNWLLILFIVECVIWGFARIILMSNIENLGYCLLAVTFYVVTIILIGACMKCDVTLYVVQIFFGTFLLVMFALTFLLLDLLASVPYAAYVYVTIAVIITTVFLLYHSQIIIGGRYSEIRMNDYLVASLLLFNDFVLLFIICFFLASFLERTTST